MDTLEATRLGRNDVCRCGSGKKYKKCCLYRQTGAASRLTFCPPPLPPRSIPNIPLGDLGLEAFEHVDVVFVNGRGWTHESELKPGDQYRLKGGEWGIYQPERVIGTTHEHPFFVQDKGWTPAGELQPGEMIRTEDGWVPVKAVQETGRAEAVYNLHVEDHHTYFVGAPEWGFSVWAHNIYFGPRGVSELVRGGGLAAHEAAGGHAIARHIGQAVGALRARLAAQPWISAASTFYNRRIAELAINRAVVANSAAISAWLAGNAARLPITFNTGSNIGRVLLRNASGSRHAQSLRVILQRASGGPGFRIVTGFPIL